MTSSYPRPAHAAAGRGELRPDIEYGRVAGNRLLMDAWIPSGAGPFPAVVIVHGGGWVAGDRRTTVQPLFAPLEEAGFAWFSISYRLANDISTFGVAIDDVETAVHYVQEHAAEFHVDPNRIALIGESAGGQLASMAALRGGLNGSIRGVVALYSPSDLVALANTSRQVPEALRQAVSGGPWASFVQMAIRRLSPIEHVNRDSPPFLLIHGTADPLVPFEQSTAMCARMRAAGAQCEVYPVQGAGHGIRWWDRAQNAYQLRMVEWLAARLRQPVERKAG